MMRFIALFFLAMVFPIIARADPPRPAIPAINWLHPMNRQLALSIVMSGGNGATDLNTRLRGAVTGTWTGGTTTQMGNSLTAPATGHIDFLNRPTITETQWTFWTIFSVSSLAATQDIFMTGSSSAGGYTIEINTTGQIDLRANGGSAQFTNCSNLVVNTTYLMIVSLSPNGTACLQRILGTNTISTSTGTTIAAGGADNGTMQLGTNTQQSNHTTVTYAAAAWSYQALPLSMMVKLANDPWGPWRVPFSRGTTANILSSVIPIPTPVISPFTHP